MFPGDLRQERRGRVRTVRYLVLYVAGGFVASLTQAAMTFWSARPPRRPGAEPRRQRSHRRGARRLLRAVSRLPVATWVVPVWVVKIPAWMFLGLWFMYQLVEERGLFDGEPTGAARVLRPRRRVRLRRARTRLLVGGTSHTPRGAGDPLPDREWQHCHADRPCADRSARQRRRPRRMAGTRRHGRHRPDRDHRLTAPKGAGRTRRGGRPRKRESQGAAGTLRRAGARMPRPLAPDAARATGARAGRRTEPSAISASVTVKRPAARPAWSRARRAAPAAGRIQGLRRRRTGTGHAGVRPAQPPRRCGARRQTPPQGR